MSESQQVDVKRRWRARFVDALTAATWQPGERSRTGTKLAGAAAVVALVAGGMLGLGAWRSYHHRDGRTNNVAGTSPARTASPSSPSSPSPSIGQTGPPGSSTDPASPSGPSSPPQPVSFPTTQLSPSDPKAGAPSDPKAGAQSGPKASAQSLRTVLPRTLLQNAATKKCADLPGKGPGKQGGTVDQSGCNRSAGDNQAWTVKLAHAREAPGHRDLVLIDNAKDGLCMDLPTTHAVAAGTKVTENTCNADKHDNQLWWVSTQRDGKQLIHNYASKSACLQIGKQKAARRAGLPLRVGTCAVGHNNRWQFAR